MMARTGCSSSGGELQSSDSAKLTTNACAAAGRSLALTDPAGDTATMRECGANTIARLDDAGDIETRLQEFIGLLRARTASGVAPDVASRYSRRAQTANLAALFDRVGAVARKE
jgi:hypothetical protein